MRIKNKLIVYKDKSKEWRWTVYSANGKKLFSSSEGYKRIKPCMDVLFKFINLFVVGKSQLVKTIIKNKEKK